MTTPLKKPDNTAVIIDQCFKPVITGNSIWPSHEQDTSSKMVLSCMLSELKLGLDLAP